MGRFALFLLLALWLPALHPAKAAHVPLGTPVADAQMQTLEGGRARLLPAGGAAVLVFYRPGQARSSAALKELAACQAALADRPLHWRAVAADVAPAAQAAQALRESGFAATGLLDAGDRLYGALGLSMHPVVAVISRDGKLAAFEPFRSVGFCQVVSARLRHLLGELPEEQLQRALNPGADRSAGAPDSARRYLHLAEALFRAKNYDKALEMARRSLQADPMASAAHALLGDILAAQGRCDEARPAFLRALELDAAGTAGEAIRRCGP